MNWNNLTEKTKTKEQEEMEKINSTIIDRSNNNNNRPPSLNKQTKFEEILMQPNANEIIFTLTGFTLNEFTYLFSIVEEALTPTGQGKKPTITPKDAFLFTLQHLKTGESPNGIAAVYLGKPDATFRAIKSTIQKCGPVLESKFIKAYSMEQQIANKWDIKEFPNCLLVVDSTFQSTTKPLVGFKGAKLMFSGKHYAYGYKTQCLHAMNGLCVRYDSEFYGSQHDFDIFNSTLPEFESLLKNGNGEYYSVMADLGYIGDTSVQGVELITPFKNTSQITPEEMQMNRLISSKRIICENYYGRLKGKFKIMRDKYTLSKGKYKSYVGMCIALTNYHILVNPLRDADGEFNKRYEQTSIDERFSKYTELKRNRKVQQQRKKQKIQPMTINRNGNVVTIGSQESIEEFNQNDYNNNMLDNF